MNQYNTKYGTYTSSLNLNVDESNIKMFKTIEDFDNDDDMYRIFLEIESTFNNYEKRVDNILINEDKKNKK